MEFIQVIMHTGEETKVPTWGLQAYIEDKSIIKFKRSDGWVEIGKDPIRQGRRINSCYYSDQAR